MASVLLGLERDDPMDFNCASDITRCLVWRTREQGPVMHMREQGACGHTGSTQGQLTVGGGEGHPWWRRRATQRHNATGPPRTQLPLRGG